MGRRGERGGAVTLFVAITAVALLAVGGMVIDGGDALAGRREAMTDAEQAARVGADALNNGAMRVGVFRVDPAAAVNAAEGYLHSVGAHGTVRVNGAEVTVTVTRDQPTTILSAIGITHMPVSSSATATAIDEDTN